MNISSKYDLGDIVNQLGSSSAVKPGAEKGAEGIFAALISNLAVAGITGKVADEVAEAVRYCFESTFNVNKIVIQKNAR